jgi:hypothetical protein
MALLADIHGTPFTGAAGTTEAHITLAGHGYDFVHLGKNASGVTDAETIFIAPAAGITATFAEGQKIAVLSGYAIEIPRNWKSVYFRTGAGAPCFSIRPKRGY